MKSLKERVFYYIDTLVKKEKDKWESGMKNDYFNYEDDAEDIKNYEIRYSHAKLKCDELQKEVDFLRKKIRKLEEKKEDEE